MVYLTKKKLQLLELKTILFQSDFLLIINHNNLTTEELKLLRQQLSIFDYKIKMINNNLITRVLDKTYLENLQVLFKTSTLIVSKKSFTNNDFGNLLNISNILFQSLVYRPKRLELLALILYKTIYTTNHFNLFVTFPKKNIFFLGLKKNVLFKLNSLKIFYLFMLKKLFFVFYLLKVIKNN